MSEPSDFSVEDIGNSRKSEQWVYRLHRFKLKARRRWWIAALTIMVGLGIGDYFCRYHVPEYYSSSRMIMSGRLSLPQGDVYSEELTNFYGTQVALMQSPAILNRAFDQVNATHSDIVPDYSSKVEVSVEPRTSIFNLKVTSSNPAYARVILDAIMDTYLADKRSRRNLTTDEAVSAITEDISRLEQDIKNDDQQLLDFQKQNDVVFIEAQSNSSAAYLVGLNRDLAQLTRQRDLLASEDKDPLVRSSYDQTPALPGPVPDATTPTTSDTPAPATPPANEINPFLTEKDKIEKMKILRDQLGVYLKDQHPKMIALADEIQSEQKFLDDLKDQNSKSREVSREDLDLQIKNLQAQIEAWNTKSLKLSESLGIYQQLKSKLGRDESLYNQLAQSIQNVDFNKLLDEENVVIMEAASKAKPVETIYALYVVYGFFGGLAVGLGLIYLINRFDDKIDSVVQIQESFHLPVMGQLPRVSPDKKTKRVALVKDTDQRYELMEYLNNLRSVILFQSAEGVKLGSLMICSAAPNEGKSTLAGNLAIVLANSGLRVLLIDADLRRGSLHKLFGLPVGPGLSEYLQGQVSWPDAVRETDVANLSVMPRGKALRRAGDLLLGSPVDVLLQEAEATYDVVLWDSAPLLAVHDASNICAKMNGILFVARVRYSSINSVRSALEDLSQKHAKILGFVLNGVQYREPGNFDKYRYKAYYEIPVDS